MRGRVKGGGSAGARRYNLAVKVDAELVFRVARLAALDLSSAEAGVLSGQLTRIVEHFETLQQVPESLLRELPDRFPSPLRPDAVCPASPGALLQANAPEFAHGHFVVPRVVSRD